MLKNEDNKEEKIKEIESAVNLFFNNFKKKDEFTKIFLEIIFENLKKNEKKL